MYVNSQTGVQVDLNSLANSLNTSIPEHPNAEQLELLGLTGCIESPSPSPYHTRGDNLLIDGVWTVTWVAPTAEALLAFEQAAYTQALEAQYDAQARSHRYDNRLTCALRAGYPGPFQPEGVAFAVWMDECNAYAYAQMAAVLAGERLKPTPEELIAELPSPVWP